MLYINNQRVIENVTVYGDDKKFNVFYPVPERPSFRVDEEGKPIFKFLKYRLPIDRPDGKKGGGYAVFSTELVIPDKKMARIKKKLQEEVNRKAQKRKISPPPPVKISSIKYTKGTTRIAIMNDNKALVERVWEAGKPSLYGNNVAAFAVEFTPEGATFFEQALQGKGGLVVVYYELYHDAKLPPLTVKASFNASAFYSFVQKINMNRPVCSKDDYKETLTEIMSKSESRSIEVDPGSTQIDPKIINQVEAWARGALDDAAERLMIKALPIENPEDARKWYKKKGVKKVQKEVLRTSCSSFDLDYKRETYIEVNINPQDPLPNITTLKDKKGKPIKWKDYAQEIDLNDKFFKQLNVSVRVNAPFEELPIHSIETKLFYKGKPMDVLNSKIDGEFQFINGADVAQFASFVENEDYKYTYSYQVNYKGSSRVFQSKQIKTDESVLTINVDDAGILYVDITPGDIDFEQVKQAQITLEYDAPGVDKITDQFIMTAESSEHKFEHIIFEKRSKPYRYKVNYKMADGKEFESDWKEESSNRLFINDPFTQSKTVGFRASGDLENTISNIFIDATYEDTTNDYKITQSIALSKDNAFFDWFIPMIDQNADTITYKGHVVRKDGTQEEIPETTTDSSTIIVGENVENLMDITVMADLLDFANTLKLAHVQLEYIDAENNISERKDFTFKEGAMDPGKWLIKLKDKSKKDYNWQATFFLKDGTRKETDSKTVDDLTLFLELPSN